MNGTWTESISQILGWCYFVLWSLSFYPQVPQNHRRRSTDGFSIDFALLNVLGLSAYTVFSACFLFSPVVHAQYAQRHPQSPEPTVQWNDFVYALHGALICCWTSSHFLCARFWNFNSKQQRAAVNDGVSIGAILVDLSGAVVSLMQLVLDSSLQADWSGAIGNIAKLLLGNISVLFDLIFIFQHFGLHRERLAENKPGLSERDPLLDSRNEA
ncbi:hypothetical protein NUH16_004244 [Penicillium rubens]|uniref:uncharacterized protein n=1 Tax=Penicillium rubens TaxID=1108849 RepID=UPI002A5A0D32|nr:uncharacterized protein N7525_010693 [Penicillium rubens]KAJ5036370.1 hypothetical protein NUH16_004244 [Penicillium rubens]KAJ5821409.1 hypothetical protein N7525_010693 [Penicillium rubens]KAJ5859054.1 hypothetical protein N7534_004331 [Penicillium rubens]